MTGAVLLMSFVFVCHSGKDGKEFFLIPLELLQKGLLQIILRVSESVKVKQRFCLSSLRDLLEQHGNGPCLGVVCLHECAIFLREVFLHPRPGLDNRAMEMMFPLATVQITAIPRLIRFYRKRIEPARPGLCFVDSTSVIVQENARIILTDRLQKVDKVTAFIEHRRFGELFEELIGAANVNANILQVLGQVENILTVHRNRFFHMAAAFRAARAFEADLR